MHLVSSDINTYLYLSVSLLNLKHLRIVRSQLFLFTLWGKKDSIIYDVQ